MPSINRGLLGLALFIVALASGCNSTSRVYVASSEAEYKAFMDGDISREGCDSVVRSWEVEEFVTQTQGIPLLWWKGRAPLQGSSSEMSRAGVQGAMNRIGRVAEDWTSETEVVPLLLSAESNTACLGLLGLANAKWTTTETDDSASHNIQEITYWSADLLGLHNQSMTLSWDQNSGMLTRDVARRVLWGIPIQSQRLQFFFPRPRRDPLNSTGLSNGPLGRRGNGGS